MHIIHSSIKISLIDDPNSMIFDAFFMFWQEEKNDIILNGIIIIFYYL